MSEEKHKTYNDFSLNYEKYSLNNGLEIILHENHNNPIVAVAIQYHVGSNRELPGKTGFAHLFEHLLFQRSEHLKRNDYFSKISDLGGNFNGGTWEDGTVYYECVPNDALEKILWMESDRMGFFINTVTPDGIEREKDIVINEKRQMVDNQPYGHTENVQRNYLYPSDHPYHWSVIGDMGDLRSATLDDVKDFYFKWYQPNNATLAISGDFDTNDTKTLIEKYFGEIKSNNKIDKNKVYVPKLTHEYRLMHEDKFANMPELNITFPTTEQYNRDSYALDLLSELLSVGKNAPLYKELISTYLAPDVAMYSTSREICGETTIKVKTFPGVSLNDAFDAIQRAFKSFESSPIDKDELDRIKKMTEIQYYQGFSSNLYVALNIAQYNVFGGSPDVISEELEMIKSITTDDIIRVYNKYIKNKPFVATSFVPLGQAELALSDSEIATVVEEKVDNQELNSDAGAIADGDYSFSDSSFDRSIEPALGKLNNVKAPDIWNFKLDNGLKTYGISQNQLPLTAFSFVMLSGAADCKDGKAGVANLTAKILKEGTATKTPEEIEKAFRNFGCDFLINVKKEFTTFTTLCLSKDFAEVVKLVGEILTEPRWDETEFERLKQEALASIQDSLADPQQLGRNEFAKAVLGNNVFATAVIGTTESVNNITIDDLKQFYSTFYSPSNCNLIVTGKISQQIVENAIKDLDAKWSKKDVPQRVIPEFKPSEGFFTKINFPDAKQSYIAIGRNTAGRNDPSYLKSYVANYKLGDGSGGRLFKVLRLEHGYTYGAYSTLIPSKNMGFFRAAANVQSSVTQESVDIFLDLIRNYKNTYTEDDLESTKTSLIRKESGNYETLSSLLDVLIDISVMGLPLNYIEEEVKSLKKLTYNEILDTIDKYLNINDMRCVVVGDNRILKKLK